MDQDQELREQMKKVINRITSGAEISFMQGIGDESLNEVKKMFAEFGKELDPEDIKKTSD